MLTFKQFLNTQSDDIEDMEAVRKYQEYKLEFRKTQIADFFTSHKEEEWYVYIEMRFSPGDCLCQHASNCTIQLLILTEYQMAFSMAIFNYSVRVVLHWNS
jgi:hypothetical protein